MKKGKLYGVGVGPGDRELITLKALRVLRESEVIMVPVMKSGEKTAFGIVGEYIDGKEIVECRMPMTKDLKVLNENYEAIKCPVILTRGRMRHLLHWEILRFTRLICRSTSL